MLSDLGTVDVAAGVNKDENFVVFEVNLALEHLHNFGQLLGLLGKFSDSPPTLLLRKKSVKVLPGGNHFDMLLRPLGRLADRDLVAPNPKLCYDIGLKVIVVKVRKSREGVRDRCLYWRRGCLQCVTSCNPKLLAVRV